MRVLDSPKTRYTGYMARLILSSPSYYSLLLSVHGYKFVNFRKIMKCCLIVLGIYGDKKYSLHPDLVRYECFAVLIISIAISYIMINFGSIELQISVSGCRQ